MKSAVADYQLDACRLLCPLPVIKTQNRVRELAHGDVLEVLATDPGVLNDVPAWARINGHQVLESGRRDGIIFVRLQVVRDTAVNSPHQ
ncbi:sulfurtransferase TusA family protein [Alcanivorax quisquiliarum]|uniref:Sulfurtransferase TusA family protein n=1 Tax=Alcanivorax quisquiliarum TaxID=2933565 RepID=A0ABT0E5Q6_9GAMM|nr:sulfurtransferase TusA family protein [Alcanivorax quisquiliarum]